MSGAIELGVPQLAIAGGLVVLAGGLSVLMELGVGKRLAIAALRTVVQLTILGALLEPLFRSKLGWLVGLACLAMIALAAHESVRRAGRRYRGIRRDAFLSLLVAGGCTALLATTVVVGVEPWWEPRYLIPILGMILGNGLTGISLGLDLCLRSIDEGRQRVESLLVMGATPREASRPVARAALRSGLVPILNSMNVVGLVTVPGMMTGQILGGTDPLQAARYQIMILFVIAGATALGTAGVVLLALRALFDAEGRLRPERLRRVED